MRQGKLKGVTLIELIWVIVIMGVALPVLLRMWADVAWRGVRSEAIADATFYAQELMEEIKSKRFDENITPPWSATLGPNSGESGRASFDDVDDFNGYSDTPATGYTRTVAVNYAALSGSTWTVSGTSTDFKQITVVINHNKNFFKDLTLVTIEGAY